MNALTQMGRAIRSGMRDAGGNNHGKMDHALSDDELRRAAPSIFAVAAHESRSARFVPVPTFNVVEGMRANGFFPFEAKQAKARDLSRREFTKHMIRFRRIGDGNGTIWSKEAIAEIVLINANDGSSSYQLFGGLFVTLCLNGLIVADSLIQSIRIGHKGNIVGQVVDGSTAVLEGTQKALAVRDDWARIELSSQEAEIFAVQAHKLRFENEATPIRPQQLLIARRREDAAPDLWHTFNRVQENALQGGLSGNTKAGWVKQEGQPDKWKPSRLVTTRKVGGIDQDVKLNRALWSLADAMAKLKTGEPVAALEPVQGEIVQ